MYVYYIVEIRVSIGYVDVRVRDIRIAYVDVRVLYLSLYIYYLLCILS